MFAHIRFASLFAILTPILVATPMTRQFPFLGLNAQLSSQPEFFQTMSRASRAVFYPLCALIAFGLFLFGAYGPPISPKPSITPAAAVDYIVAKSLTEQRLYNQYDFGGYLIFRNIKTFVDGRSDQLFLQGFTERLFDCWSIDPGNLLRSSRNTASPSPCGPRLDGISGARCFIQMGKNIRRQTC